MFADDTTIWAKVKDLLDITSRQQDLDEFGTLTEKWTLQLVIDKCKIMATT